ncbi:MAG: 4'-phosphopantetheinyl transferase superfamily protein [Cytophagales bacterium]|nr:4'-phosphopantetheinyl transferase superfamily protein [Cytophagales bacterium]
MPLIQLESLGETGAWGLWNINETEPDLSFLSFESCPENVVHAHKRLEWLAGRALIRSLVEAMNLSYDGIRKDEFGKPFLKSLPHFISLSHSYPYVAAQIDRSQSVGIDVEQPKEKLRQVGPRVLAAEELADAGNRLDKLCIYWCAKEALYKIYGRKNLLFSDHLRILPFQLSETGLLNGKIVFPEHKNAIGLRYRVTTEYVLVYTDNHALP